ncbi:sulfatase [Flavivirga amylovorans]|uniref:Sulfatase n=1 Tax=Flavivirga amylovorans TaxID=870486 RepID=A0ABT8WX11_9FLAO|nr:sulfatase [Flavivirga amylovorans]MDO5986203.1 sulfatase [Flavivirga amylovorans]
MMNRILQYIFLLFFIGSTFAQSKKPNILFIMSDDHTSQAVGVYNSRLTKLNPTPVIDQIAKEGIIMENAFCTNAICTPSRACIMTGQYSAVNGVTTLGGRLPENKQYLAKEMKKAGYTTAVIGKWHLKELPTAFDYWKVLPGQGNYFDPYFRMTGGTESYKKAILGKSKEYSDGQHMKGHSSDCIGESTLNWFKNVRDPKKPFFLKMHFKAPHGGFEYAPRYEDYLANVEIPEPKNLYESGNHGSIGSRGYKDELIHVLGSSISPRCPLRNYSSRLQKQNPELSDREVTHLAYQNYLKKYLRCVKGVDDNIKKVVDYLKAEGLYDNTVIIYTGDQGFYLGEHDYIDKRWGYEEGMRMPFIVRYPKSIPAGQRSDAIIENVDYPVMMLDYAGVDKPDYMQGKSFRYVMEKGKEPKNAKTAAYYHYWMHLSAHYNPAHIAIRDKKYKLIYFYGARQKETKAETPPSWELYDLEKDPGEMNNLYGNKKYDSVIDDLKVQLRTLRSEYKEDDPKYACNQVIDEYWDYTPEQQKEAIEISHRYYEASENMESFSAKKKRISKENVAKEKSSKKKK